MDYFRFLELAKNGNISKAEKLFEILAGVFEIDKSEREKFIEFIFHTAGSAPESPYFLIIDNNSQPADL
jgi:hypothetical protein